MSTPEIAGRKPVSCEVSAGQSYAWCACGRSEGQPFCDGSHRGTGLAPVPFSAEASESVALCMCKRTHTPPCCDGSHANLPPE
ncbi:MAG: CDGSH iron-sulfur domain-containing protein [Planctomycetota bacterium]